MTNFAAAIKTAQKVLESGEYSRELENLAESYLIVETVILNMHELDVKMVNDLAKEHKND